MRGLVLLSGVWVLGCSPQPKCTYVVCTQNVAQACGQLQALGGTCGESSSNAALTTCEDALATDCSESETNTLANTSGCYGASTPCAGAAKTVQACFDAASLTSGCRSAVSDQIKVFLPDAG